MTVPTEAPNANKGGGVWGGGGERPLGAAVGARAAARQQRPLSAAARPAALGPRREPKWAASR